MRSLIQQQFLDGFEYSTIPNQFYDPKIVLIKIEKLSIVYNSSILSQFNEINLNCIHCMRIMVSKNIIAIGLKSKIKEQSMSYSSTILTEFNELKVHTNLKRSNYPVRTKLHNKGAKLHRYLMSNWTRKKSIQKPHKNLVYKLNFLKKRRISTKDQPEPLKFPLAPTPKILTNLMRTPRNQRVCYDKYNAQSYVLALRVIFGGEFPPF